MEWNGMLFYILIHILMYATYNGKEQMEKLHFKKHKFYFKKEENHFHLIIKEMRWIFKCK